MGFLLWIARLVYDLIIPIVKLNLSCYVVRQIRLHQTWEWSKYAFKFYPWVHTNGFTKKNIYYPRSSIIKIYIAVRELNVWLAIVDSGRNREKRRSVQCGQITARVSLLLTSQGVALVTSLVTQMTCFVLYSSPYDQIKDG